MSLLSKKRFVSQITALFLLGAYLIDSSAGSENGHYMENSEYAVLVENLLGVQEKGYESYLKFPNLYLDLAKVNKESPTDKSIAIYLFALFVAVERGNGEILAYAGADFSYILENQADLIIKIVRSNPFLSNSTCQIYRDSIQQAEKRGITVGISGAEKENFESSICDIDS